MGLGFGPGVSPNGPNRRFLQFGLGLKELQGGQRAAGRLNLGSWVVSEEAAHSSFFFNSATERAGCGHWERGPR